METSLSEKYSTTILRVTKFEVVGVSYTIVGFPGPQPSCAINEYNLMHALRKISACLKRPKTMYWMSRPASFRDLLSEQPYGQQLIPIMANDTKIVTSGAFLHTSQDLCASAEKRQHARRILQDWDLRGKQC